MLSPARLRSAAAPILLGILGLLFHASPAGEALNNRLQDWRMAESQLAASGQVVFVAIDSGSLREVGNWPWSRAVHGQLLDRLTEAGARDVFFDIDFSAARDAGGDGVFVEALDRAGGATYLAAFAQQRSGAPNAPLVFNLPHPTFQPVSWPATVNVMSAADGLIRTYAPGVSIDGVFVPSAGSLLAGGSIAEDSVLAMNFAISPATVPTVSAYDVLAGSFDSDLVRGRSVIIGSSAIELGDFHAVPVHQVIPGALIHAIAAETMMADLALRWTHPAPLAGLMIALFVLLNTTLREKPWLSVGILGCGLVALELVALLAFRHGAIAIPTALAHPTATLFAIGHLAWTLKSSFHLLLRKDVHIRNTENLLSHVFDQSSDGIVVVTEDGRRLMQSRAAKAIFSDKDDASLSLPPQVWAVAQAAMTAAEPPEPELHKLDLPGPKGGRSIEYLVAPSTYRDLDAPDPSGSGVTQRIATISARDVTELKRREREIAYLSTHDERTGALRRGPFLEFLRLRLDAGDPVGILVLNLNRFKSINMTLGRDIGDAILHAVVERLQDIDEGLSAVARLDGDSFALFTELSCDFQRLRAVVECVRDRVCAVYEFDGATAQIGVNLGYEYLDGATGLAPEAALARAEEALDHARSSPSDDIRRYDPKMASRRARLRAIERAMPDALRHAEFSVVYQPQHRLSDGALVGVEALVRWQSPSLGQVYPDEFITIAEKTGLIVELGRQVLFQSVRDAQEFPSGITVAVNVSGVQIDQGDICADVSQALRETGLDASRLCLELTESVLMDQVDATIEIMRDVTWTGVTWALDDFGTGFSSLAYLTQLPLSKIKLDRSFAEGLGADPAADAVLRSVVTLSRGLGLSLLCEGVETAEQAAILRDEGCAEGQGFFYGKPQTKEEILARAARAKAG